MTEGIIIKALSGFYYVAADGKIIDASGSMGVPLRWGTGCASAWTHTARAAWMR